MHARQAWSVCIIGVERRTAPPMALLLADCPPVVNGGEGFGGENELISGHALSRFPGHGLNCRGSNLPGNVATIDDVTSSWIAKISSRSRSVALGPNVPVSAGIDELDGNAKSGADLRTLPSTTYWALSALKPPECSPPCPYRQRSSCVVLTRHPPKRDNARGCPGLGHRRKAPLPGSRSY